MTVKPSQQFIRDVKALRKRFRNIERDLKPLIAQLEAGETPGDRLQGLEQEIYKVRLPNSDAGRGKSGGYRVIYYVRSESRISLVTIYFKSDQTDISIVHIQQILQEISDAELAEVQEAHLDSDE